MVIGTLSRYFATRFLSAMLAVFFGIFVLTVMVDYIEQVRRTATLTNVPALSVFLVSFYRVPQILERLMPFCVLVGAMSCYLTLSRRLELVVARAAGISAWQFVMPAAVCALLFGVFATTVYNPVSATLQERSRRMEMEMFGQRMAALWSNLWITQVTAEGQAIINANGSAGQGELLTGVTIFRFEPDGSFKDRIEAQRAVLEGSRWRLEEVRRFTIDDAPVTEKTAFLSTNLSANQVRESFAMPETVSFWQLPEYISSTANSGLAAAGYKLQYQKLLARPFLLTAMVLLAAAVSLRFFRFGGVQKMVLSGIAAGFLLYVLSKVTEDLSKAELMHPIAAAWLPVLVGGLTGFMALLYQEDG
jgi:lipopolysaccharide export system permease protein